MGKRVHSGTISIGQGYQLARQVGSGEQGTLLVNAKTPAYAGIMWAIVGQPTIAHIIPRILAKSIPERLFCLALSHPSTHRYRQKWPIEVGAH